MNFWDLTDETDFGRTTGLAATSSAHDHHAHSKIKNDPYKSQAINVKDEIIDVAWSPKNNNVNESKERYYVFTKNGLIEEQTFTEFKRFTSDLSARGHLCMSGHSNKTLHTLPFFDSVFDYEALKV